MNVTKRISHKVPRVSRKQASTVYYSVSTIEGDTKLPMVMPPCPDCGIVHVCNDHYPKPGRQHIPAEQLMPEDFRELCCICHDIRRKENRKERNLYMEQLLSSIRRTVDGLPDKNLSFLFSFLRIS